MTTHDPYSTPNSELDTNKSADTIRKPGKAFLSLTIILIIVNSLLSIALGDLKEFGFSGSLGYMFGTAHLLPLTTIVILSIWKSNRNRLTRVRTYFWWSIIILLSIISQFSHLVQQSNL